MPMTPDQFDAAATALADLVAKARGTVRHRLAGARGLDPAALEREQHMLHGLAWLATYGETLKSLAAWVGRLSQANRFTEIERLIAGIAFGEYLEQVIGGIPMNQQEFVRPGHLALADADLAALKEIAAPLIAEGSTPAARRRLVDLMVDTKGAATFGDCGLDETLDQIRLEMRRFVEDRVAPNAHEWHRHNAYVPLELIAELAALGVFGMTLPEQHGGLGLGKEAMCVVSEELSRGWIAVGSLGTRSEIASELILAGGTEDQKRRWLPRLASGEIIPTAVFTEPDTGSDLASLRTRAERSGDHYRITGNKTWITHPVRADLMTLLARTDPAEPGYRGLSMFLAEKPRGTDHDPFPAAGMSGGEIEVLGYRGMKEFEIRFEGFEVKAENLLGGREGQGFKQLMPASRLPPAPSALPRTRLISGSPMRSTAASSASRSSPSRASPTSWR